MGRDEQGRLPRRDEPWVFRTYSGHTSAGASNALYRSNLAKGQTGLSVAFDLPTQTGYDADHPLARGEVGKVGVPISHIEDMEALFEGIPLDRMNTSMTINATAAWLLALYVAAAERQGVSHGALSGTTQNDIIKEYLSRGTYVFPPEPSLRLITDMVAYTVDEIPKWNPINVCSYHLQEAGATPVQEIAYAMATAIAVLDAVRARADVPADAMPRVFGRISFFLNAGHPLRRGGVQGARDGRALGRDRPRPATGRRRAGAALPLRRAGEQPGPHRGAAREQRDPHRPRGPRRHALARGALPGAPAPRLERGAGPAAALGPAVVAAHPADPRLRDRPPRVRRPLRRLAGGRGAQRRAAGRGAQRAREGARHGRRRRGRRERLHEAAAGRVPHPAAARDRVRGDHGGRRQRVHRERAVGAHGGRAAPILRVDEAAEREQIERLRAFRSRRSGAEARGRAAGARATAVASRRRT